MCMWLSVHDIVTILKQDGLQLHHKPEPAFEQLLIPWSDIEKAKVNLTCMAGSNREYKALDWRHGQQDALVKSFSVLV